MPEALPDQDGLVYIARTGADIWVVGAMGASADRPIVRIDAPSPAQAVAIYRQGHLLVAVIDRAGHSQLTAQPVRVPDLKVFGEATVLATDVNQNVTASTNGVLAYAIGAERQELVWLDDNGAATDVVLPSVMVSNMDLSYDDRLLVLQEQPGIRILDLNRGVATTLVPDGADPIMSPDGRQVAFADVSSKNLGVYVIPSAGGTARLLYSSPNGAPTYIDGWSADGRGIAGHVNAQGGGILIPTFAGGKAVLFGDTVGVDEARFSPDGKWLPFGLNSTGQQGNVFGIPLPPTGERWQVSVAGGAQPRWRADGTGIYFLSASGGMMLADFDGHSNVPKISSPRELFKTNIAVQYGVDQYAVAHDGKRFLVRRERVTAARDEIQLVTNWPALVKSSKQ